MAEHNSNQSIAERLQAAFLVGPPEEVCMVLDGDKLRHFDDGERGVIGAYPIEPLRSDFTEISLYGQSELGWTLALEETPSNSPR